MCDVVFITPNIDNNIASESIGTLELATILKGQGISCEILPFFRIGDVNTFEAFLDNAVDIIAKKQPKIVSFYTRCDFYHVDLKLAQLIKERFDDIYIVFGGPQADITCVETLKNMPFVDYVCCGEGENTIYPLFSSLLKNSPDLTVDGLVYRLGDEIKKNPRPALVEDLDSLPMIDYSLAGYENVSPNIVFPIDVGRGCPFGCVFCSTKSFWGRKYRLKSSQRILEEVKAINREFGITRFNFTHDMFTFNKNKVMEVCKLLQTLDFPIKWTCSARLDCLDYELIDEMVKSGLGSIYFGVETGSPRMQKLTKKNLKIENALDIIEYISQKNVITTVSFIYGFPEETEEDVSLTLALIAKLLGMNNMTVQTHLCAFFSETDLTNKYRDQLTPTEQFSNMTGDCAIDECKDLITAYPDLFEQMLEYKTELREKLRHFSVFMRVWRDVAPVYKYISGGYSQEKMLDMYFDFVKANYDILTTDGGASDKQKANLIIENDKFALRFKDDENFDVISDYYRLRKMIKAEKASGGVPAMDVFCFDPGKANNYSSISDYPRGKFVVMCKNGKLAAFPKK